ncbi:FxsA family protein [Brachybacterium sp. EF45031]|uniref:FxsA family protein n=1 Tax=Brachybacterium sillae TaxID=2810536 RepID=UPI00217D0E8D|nr:FxsA family protein [Brachybacterium sillae]MCS6710658.1 FxsA family protein [Brachybacterium sillae]
MSTTIPPIPPSPSGPRRRRRLPGWAWPLLVLLVGLVELAGLVLLGRWAGVAWALLAVALGLIIAVALVVAAGQQSYSRVRSLIRAVRGRGRVQDHLSRPAFTLLAAALFAFPGLLTDVAGLVLLLTPVQKRTVSRIAVPTGVPGARRMLFRGPGTIDGEIVVRRTDDPSDPSGAASSPETPPQLRP